MHSPDMICIGRSSHIYTGCTRVMHVLTYNKRNTVYHETKLRVNINFDWDVGHDQLPCVVEY